MAIRYKYLSVYGSVFLLSACALAYEILLMRLFSIIHWHHFAYLVIGLALLGYGVSGTLVSLLQRLLVKQFNLFYPLSILLFAGSSLLCFKLAQQIPFNAEVILWDPQQIWYLVALFLLLAIPFFFAATAICLAFMGLQQSTAQIYAADLVGAGAGSVLIIVLLFWLFAQQILLLISIVALLAVVIALLPVQGALRYTGFGIVLLAGAWVFNAGLSLELKMSPYKALSQALQVTGAKVVEQRSSPLGLLTVVENDSVPFRYAPGLSLNAVQKTVPQLALFTDADGMTVISKFPSRRQQLSYLDFMTSALPYHLSDIKSVLIAAGGGGSDVLQALYHDIPAIDVLELNPQLIELVDENFGLYSGSLYSQKNIATHVEDVRDFLQGAKQKFQLIQMTLIDSASVSSSGLHALNESYLYTTQALQLYLDRLQPGGYLSLTRWISLPPRDTLKLLNSAVQTLRADGIEDAARRMVLIRSWQTSTLLIKNGFFQGDEIEHLLQFARQRSFDVAWFPGIEREQVNRYNRLASPIFFTAAQQILSGNSDFINNYKFDLMPATDDRPFFHFYFKWQTFRELFKLREQGGMPLMEWGYLILIATLLVSVLVSVLLILIPLWVFNNRGARFDPGLRQRDVVLYFFSIGLAFLMIEIAFMQKFILFLRHPIYSIAVTLTAFLVFAGSGSHVSQELARHFGKQRLLEISCLGLLFIGLLYLFMLGSVFETFSDQSLLVRGMISMVLIAPLAFFMGMPFPLALSNLAEHAEGYIPWAWGINGCASVISASLATLLAIHFGFNSVILLALLLYLFAVWFFPRVKTA